MPTIITMWKKLCRTHTMLLQLNTIQEQAKVTGSLTRDELLGSSLSRVWWRQWLSRAHLYKLPVLYTPHHGETTKPVDCHPEIHHVRQQLQKAERMGWSWGVEDASPAAHYLWRLVIVAPAPWARRSSLSLIGKALHPHCLAGEGRAKESSWYLCSKAPLSAPRAFPYLLGANSLVLNEETKAELHVQRRRLSPC